MDKSKDTKNKPKNGGNSRDGVEYIPSRAPIPKEDKEYNYDYGFERTKKETPEKPKAPVKPRPAPRTTPPPTPRTRTSPSPSAERPPSRERTSTRPRQDNKITTPKFSDDFDSFDEEYDELPTAPAERPRAKRKPNVSDNPNLYKPRTSPEGVKSKNIEAPGSRRQSQQQKTQMAIFIIALVAVVSVVAVVTFAAMYNTFKDKYANGKLIATPQPSATATPRPPAVEDNEEYSLAMIVSMSEASKRVDLYDFVNDKNFTMYADSKTTFLDKFDNNLVFEVFKSGDIVDIVYEKDSTTILEMSQNAEAWKFKMINNVTVNTEEMKVNAGGRAFIYDLDLIVQYKDKPFDVSNIDAVDNVTISGYGDKVLHINVNTAHGFLKIENNKDVINATVEIDTSTFVLLTDDPIKVVEGTRRVVIKGDNIEPYVTDVLITTNETADLPLSNDSLSFNSSILTFEVNEPDTAIIVDGFPVSLSEPIVVLYGEHEIKAIKEGFEELSEVITVGRPKETIEVTLVKKVMTSTFTITTTPEGANVYIDGTYVGISPATVTVEHGLHSLKVQKESYIEVTFPIQVDESFVPPNFTLQDELVDDYGYDGEN